ncbi:hypothetical protein KCG44_07980 [Pacificimonas sp. WHA3]|uniref:Uncharacterized protein n=1 Tax=Pacificimonas pallii TaxID=2827236 RepID=A0ABS6SE82_9SPHN|nr:hypothetical protein [Pacificimonas pallii]MBV7256723.1 hypothetical protein [Pacificimonas pallii]
MKTPAKDGMDPAALKKTIAGEGELIPERQLNEDLAVTGTPPKTPRGEQGRA